MSRPFPEDCIEKVTLLERALGAKVTYQILEPFRLDPTGIVAVQQAAKHIAQFVGLHDLTFIVAFSKQEENVAGHTEVHNDQKEVFIEIGPDIARLAPAVLATLAHEITHKYLHGHGLRVEDDANDQGENEVLTDIGAVFLGFGKLMLNGCECRRFQFEDSPGSTTMHTETFGIGYLNRDQFAFVYRLVCAMRSIPIAEFERGLSAESIHALRECENRYADYFQTVFHEPDIKDRLLGPLRSRIYETQLTLAGLDKSLQYVRAACISTAEDWLERAHRKLARVLLDAEQVWSDREYDPALRFLNAVKLDKVAAMLASEVEECSLEASQYRRGMAAVGESVHALGDVFPTPSQDAFTIVTCRNDGSKLRIPAGKARLLVKCPNCQYEFVADTSALSFEKAGKSNLHKRGPDAGRTRASILRRLVRRLRN